MKTKHLLIAMALPALFAACTNDELDVVSNDATAMKGREMVENVSLNFGDGVESRLAYGSNGYVWQANDAIGAMLMDEVVLEKYHAPYTLWTDWFDLSNYIHTNYKFTRDRAGEWTTEAKMCEGNYFFVYPYDANKGLRNAYTIKRDVQTLAGTDEASLLKAYTGNNAFVGYGKVKSGVASSESVKVDMVPAFGATGITILNTGTATYKIEKIVLRGDSVFSQATINPTTTTAKLQYSSRTQDRISTWNNSGHHWTTADFNVSQYTKEEKFSDGGLYDNAWTGYNAIAALKDVLDYAHPSNDEEALQVFINSGNVIGKREHINVIAMLGNINKIKPAEYDAASGTWNDEGNAIILDIYTDQGLIRDIKLNYHYTATNGGLNSSGDDKVTNVLTDKAIAAVGDGKTIMITFDDTSLDVPKVMDIKGNDELANLIHWNAKASAPITADLKKDVTITKAMYNELAASKITVATINGNDDYSVTIAADVPAGALDLFKFEDVANVYVEGTQTLSADNGASNIVVNGTLNVTGNKKSFTKITNY